MSRQVTEPAPPSASSHRAAHRLDERRKRSQVIAVSNVSDSTPIATNVSRRYGARRNASRQAPDAAAALGARSPPCSPHSAAAALEAAPTCLLEAEHEQVAPSPANVSARLARVDQPAVGGPQPGLHDRAHRVARRPRTRRTHATPSGALRRRGRTRTHASVMTPSVPSEPSSSRSGDGPAPEPGSRRDSQTRRAA